MTSGSDDVLVTGVGLVTPLGNSADVTWNRLLVGDKAGRILKSSDIDHFEQLSGIAKDFDFHGALDERSRTRSSLIESKLLANFPSNVADAWLSEPLVAMSLVAYL
ncbi:MAG: hypothetical protein U0936_22815 [Planctomycetaceae bacterium]